MKYGKVICFIIPFTIIQTAKCDDSINNLNIKVNHLVREQMFSLSVNYPIFKNIICEADYGYKYFHRAGLSIGYRFDLEHYAPYLLTGLFYKRDNFAKGVFYQDLCLRLGGGLETNLSKKIFFNFETSFLNYFSMNYSSRKIKYREIYDLGESVEYTVSFGLGYRFNL